MSKQKLFSGEASRELWRRINNARDMLALQSAMYLLAAHCQELEERITAPKKPRKRKP